MKHLENICQNRNITFSAINNNHCRCLTHIMNIAVQEILKQIKASEAETKDTLLDMAINSGDIIPKVNYFINVLLNFNYY